MPADGGHGPWGWHGHGHGWHGHWPPPQEEEEEEIEQPAGFRNATPCSAYYGQELASTLPAFGDGFPNPLPYAVCGYKPAQLQGAYNLAGPIAGPQRLGRDGRDHRRLRVADALQRRGRVREKNQGTLPGSTGGARSSGSGASSRR